MIDIIRFSRIVGVEVVEVPDPVEVDATANAEEEPVGIVNVVDTAGAIAIVDGAGDARMGAVGAGLPDGVVDDSNRKCVAILAAEDPADIA